jgi:hypothetical protein
MSGQFAGMYSHSQLPYRQMLITTMVLTWRLRNILAAAPALRTGHTCRCLKMPTQLHS